MESWDEGAVRARVREMATRDPDRARFGADRHRYELAPALPEAEIKAFEEDHSVGLPAEYRSFVAEVGNGPAGPGYGLMPLTIPRPEADEEWAVDDEWKEDRLPGRLAAPFPLTEPLPGRIGAPTDELTWGTLMLAEEGCGIFVRLVLTGPRAGEVWRIDPDWGGFVPASPGFRNWYTEWLQRPCTRLTPSGPTRRPFGEATSRVSDTGRLNFDGTRSICAGRGQFSRNLDCVGRPSKPSGAAGHCATQFDGAAASTVPSPTNDQRRADGADRGLKPTLEAVRKR